MSTAAREIYFDSFGRCNFCTDFLAKIDALVFEPSRGNEELTRTLAKVKKAGVGRPYDCVIGVSGGMDSSYVAYVVKQMGLRPLAVHMDNGWNSETAVTNIKKVLTRLSIDFEAHVLDWETFRDLQLAFLKASVAEVETPTDMAIPAVLHRAASTHGIKYVLMGGNFATEGILPPSWGCNTKDVKYLKAISKRFGTGKLRNFPKFGFLTEAYYKVFRGIRIIYPLNLMPYSSREALATLEDKVGWTDHGGKHYESRITRFIHAYLLPEKFGIDVRRSMLSTQICTGQITREAALMQLNAAPYAAMNLSSEKQYIAKKFGISLEQLEEIIARPAKTVEDYPNNQARLEMLYRLYRFMFRKPRGPLKQKSSSHSPAN